MTNSPILTKTRLANGVHVVSERRAATHAAAVGLCVQCGVRYEGAEERGYAHLLEHLLFRSAGADLGLRFAALGGEINAVTGRELLALHGFVLARHAGELVSHLSAMVTAPAFSQRAIEHERAIIHWENHDADAADNAELELLSRVWPGHPISRCLSGGAPNAAPSAQRLREYWRRTFVGVRVWLFAVGALEHDAIVAAAQALGRLPPGEAAHDRPPEFHTGEHSSGEGDWLRLCWAIPTPGLALADSTAFDLMAYALGGHAQSPLSVALRADTPISYGPRSRFIRYSDCGLLIIEATCARAFAAWCRERVERLLDSVARDGFAPLEISAAREGLAVRRELEGERLDWRLEALAQGVMFGAASAGEMPPAISNAALREAEISLRRRFFLQSPA